MFLKATKGLKRECRSIDKDVAGERKHSPSDRHLLQQDPVRKKGQLVYFLYAFGFIIGLILFTCVLIVQQVRASGPKLTPKGPSTQLDHGLI